MAGGQYTARSGGARCYFSIAIQFLTLRDFDAAKAAPDVFALDSWRAELVDLFFDLCGMLERGLVHAYSYDKEIPASDWIRHRSALEHALRAAKELLGIRYFILSAAQLTKQCSVDVDELMAALARPSVETPESDHREDKDAPRVAPVPQAPSGSSKKLAPTRDAARKPLTSAQHTKLVTFVKERFGKRAPNRETMGLACEDKLHRPIRRVDLRSVFKEAGVRGPVGRPRKSGR
jgi:hypothetical protein